MARLTALPAIDIIRGFKGILDFYLWKGLPCVRAWPRWRPARQSDASLAAALLFGAIIKAFSLTHGAVLQQLAVETTGIPRTARDLTVSGIYGNLHEAAMSDFLDLLTQCRDFLSALTALLNALDSIDTDELVVNVDESVLPPLAATTTHQATMITALQKLDDLQDALESKALDRLIVRGENQLFSFKERYRESTSFTLTGANGQAKLSTVPADEVWIITNAIGYNEGGASARLTLESRQNGFRIQHAQLAPAPQWAAVTLRGYAVLANPDRFLVYCMGGAVGNLIRVYANGYKFTLET